MRCGRTGERQKNTAVAGRIEAENATAEGRKKERNGTKLRKAYESLLRCRRPGKTEKAQGIAKGGLPEIALGSGR